MALIRYTYTMTDASVRIKRKCDGAVFCSATRTAEGAVVVIHPRCTVCFKDSVPLDALAGYVRMAVQSMDGGGEKEQELHTTFGVNVAAGEWGDDELKAVLGCLLHALHVRPRDGSHAHS